MPHGAPATSHTEDDEAHTTPTILPIEAVKSHTEAATAYTHLLEPSATAHEKMVKPFLKGCLFHRIHIDYEKIFQTKLVIYLSGVRHASAFVRIHLHSSNGARPHAVFRKLGKDVSETG